MLDVDDFIIPTFPGNDGFLTQQLQQLRKNNLHLVPQPGFILSGTMSGIFGRKNVIKSPPKGCRKWHQFSPDVEMTTQE